RQPGCSVYIFDFENEFPDIGRRLAPNATTHHCNYDGVSSAGGPMFRLKVMLADVRAALHVSRGVMPYKYAQHAGPWWLREAVRASPNVVHSIEEADVVYVDDRHNPSAHRYLIAVTMPCPDLTSSLRLATWEPPTSCYFAWAEAKAHHRGHRPFGDDEIYVDPDVYLDAAYTALLQHPVFKSTKGSIFTYFHSHPLMPIASNTFREAQCAGLFIVTERRQARVCILSGLNPNTLEVPYTTSPNIFTMPAPVVRDKLIYFRASCIGRNEGKMLRAAIGAELGQTPNSLVTCHPLGWEDNMLQEMMASRFCLIPPGDTSSSRRLAEVIVTGCIPVFIGPPWPTLPLRTVVQYTQFSLAFNVGNSSAWLTSRSSSQDWDALPTIPIPSLSDIPSALLAMDPLVYEQRQYQLQLVRPMFSFARPPSSLPVANLADVIFSRMCHHVHHERGTLKRLLKRRVEG
ncbi:hypothetical protein TSOC_010611, partial [Tetrabaena socialis]